MMNQNNFKREQYNHFQSISIKIEKNPLTMFAKIIINFFLLFTVPILAREFCRHDCADKDPTCPLLKRHCKTNFVVQSTCPMTCKECMSCKFPEEENKPTCEMGTCSDELSAMACSFYKRYKYGCLIMGPKCQETCGFCQNCELPPLATETPCNDDCKDEHKSCSYWEKRGYCDPSNGYVDTRKVCKFSCKVCKPCPVKKPNLPPSEEDEEAQV